jgi:hypothetical protein
MSNELKLPKQLDRLYAVLVKGEDVPIADLHAALGLRPVADSRARQQDVSPYIIRLNRKLREHGQSVVPGQLKQTYVLLNE